MGPAHPPCEASKYGDRMTFARRIWHLGVSCLTRSDALSPKRNTEARRSQCIECPGNRGLRKEMSRRMSAISRLVRAGIVALGLLAGCNDDLGRDRYIWDASPGRLTSDAARGGDGKDAREGLGDDARRDDGIRDTSDADPDATDVTGADVGDGDTSIDANTDTSFDSTEGGRSDWGDAGAVHAVLLAASPSCLACAQTSCPGEIVGCSTVPGAPDGGSVSRSQLCAETLQCLVSTGCEAIDTSTCYCGKAVVSVPDFCTVPGAADGVCKAKLERSLESRDPKTILASMLSTDLGGGWAMLLARCMRDNACRTCFPALDAGPDATVDRNEP